MPLEQYQTYIITKQEKYQTNIWITDPDVLFWTVQLSDRKRLYSLEDDVNYHEDCSPELGERVEVNN